MHGPYTRRATRQLQCGQLRGGQSWSVPVTLSSVHGAMVPASKAWCTSTALTRECLLGVIVLHPVHYHYRIQHLLLHLNRRRCTWVQGNTSCTTRAHRLQKPTRTRTLHMCYRACVCLRRKQARRQPRDGALLSRSTGATSRVPAGRSPTARGGPLTPPPT